jgi:hypothetical protein
VQRRPARNIHDEEDHRMSEKKDQTSLATKRRQRAAEVRLPREISSDDLEELLELARAAGERDELKARLMQLNADLREFMLDEKQHPSAKERLAMLATVAVYATRIAKAATRGAKSRSVSRHLGAAVRTIVDYGFVAVALPSAGLHGWSGVMSPNDYPSSRPIAQSSVNSPGALSRGLCRNLLEVSNGCESLSTAVSFLRAVRVRPAK